MRVARDVVAKTTLWLTDLIIVSVKANMAQSCYAEADTKAAIL